jgi:hypothetical protein
MSYSRSSHTTYLRRGAADPWVADLVDQLDGLEKVRFFRPESHRNLMRHGYVAMRAPVGLTTRTECERA